jgi:hypothetical protein
MKGIIFSQQVKLVLTVHVSRRKIMFSSFSDGVGKRGMTLDGNYYGSLAHAEFIAAERYRAGKKEGSAEGYDEGWNAAMAEANPKLHGWRVAYDELQAELSAAQSNARTAYDEGHKKGWGEAVAKGTVEIVKGNNTIARLGKEIDKANALFVEKNDKIAAQQAKLDEQAAKIEELLTKVATLEAGGKEAEEQAFEDAIRIDALLTRLGTLEEQGKEDAIRINALEAADPATSLVNELKSENARLHEEVVDLEARLREHGTAFSAFPQHFPSVDVLVDTMGDVLAELDKDAPPEALGKRFAAIYSETVKHAISAGRIKVAPHEDPIFAKHSPAAYTHLVKLINHAEATPEATATREKSWSEEFSLNALTP